MTRLPVDVEKYGPLPERPHPRAVLPIPRIAFLVDIKADTCAALAAAKHGADSLDGRNWQGLADELRDVVWMLRAVQPQPEVTHENAVATANALATWLNENLHPRAHTLRPVYNAWVLLCDFIARSQQ